VCHTGNEKKKAHLFNWGCVMAWPEDVDEQLRRRWLSRLEQERLELSNSVKATFEDQSVQGDQFTDALRKPYGSTEASQKKVIIPPRLSLQSKSIQAVNPDPRALSLGVKRSFTNDDTPDVGLPVARVEPITEERSANVFVRLAHRITSSLSTFLVNTHDLQRVTVLPPDSMQPAIDESRNGPRVYESSLAHPVIDALVEPPVMHALPAPFATETYSLGQGRLRVPKRPARVRLEGVSSQGMMTRDEMLSGSGVFEPGRSEVVVSQSGIRPSSVVMVMLAGDPGPVVVQYITLRPWDGFTVHLSAPTLAKTPFNYVVLMGEQG